MTLGFPGKHLEKNRSDESVEPEAYPSTVGKIMYLVTKLFPEGTNAARELTRHFSNLGEEHHKALKPFFGYLK